MLTAIPFEVLDRAVVQSVNAVSHACIDAVVGGGVEGGTEEADPPLRDRLIQPRADAVVVITGDQACRRADEMS